MRLSLSAVPCVADISIFEMGGNHSLKCVYFMKGYQRAKT